MLVNISKGLELEVDFARFNQDVINHLLYIGAKNVLQDSHAGVTPEKSADVAADSLAVAQKKLESMYAGEIRTATSRTADPVKAEAIKIATDKIKEEARKAGKQVSKLDPKALRQAAIALAEKSAEIVAQARENVAKAKALNTDVSSVDLDSLMVAE